MNPSFPGQSAANLPVPPGDILAKAIEWAVRLQSGTASEQDRVACEAWRAALPAHEHAWQKVQGVEAAFRNLPPAMDEVALTTLEAANRRAARNGRRRALKLAGLGVFALAGGLAAHGTVSLQQRAAYATAMGERRRLVLTDGTALSLNSGSEAEVSFSLLRRLILLKQGEIFIETGRDAGSLTGKRPFWVHAAHARLEAIGTRFGVRESGDSTRVHVTEGVVAIHSLSGRSMLARAGDVIEVGAGDSIPVRVSDATFDPSGWARGALVARRMRLAEFLEELRRYRNAPLNWEPGVADLRLSGVFQLDGPDPTGRALEVLAGTLDLRIEADPSTDGIVVRAGSRI